MTVYVDVDGTLTEWNSEAGPDLWTLAKYIWMCKVMPNMIRAVILIIKALGKDKVRFLTASISDAASVEKKKMIRSLLERSVGDIPDDMFIIVPYGHKKTDYVDPRKGVLLDDYSKNLHDWINNGGAAAVKVRNNCNGKNGTWKGNSVHYTQTPESIARCVLAEAYFAGSSMF